MVFLVFLVFVSFPSCSLYKVINMQTYDEFAEVSNSFWVNLYYKFHKITMMGHDEVIYKDTVWKKKGGPVVVDKNTYILPGVTLTIEPGTKVLVAEDVRITCHGMIKAVGRPDEPITFTWKDEGKHWNVLESLNAIDGKHANRGTLEFRHCIFENGRGLRLSCSNFDVRDCVFRNNISSGLKIEYSSGVIAHNLVYNNTTEQETEGGNGGGIKVFTNLSVRVENNEVYDNVSGGGRDGGGGIYAFAYDKGDILVENNIVKNNRSDRKGGGIFAYDAVIRNNTVTNNTADMTGGGVYALQAVIEDNVIRENSSDEGGGVFSNNSRIIHNLVQKNRAAKGCGIFHMGEGEIVKNTFVENQGTIDPGSVVILLGNALVRSNNIIAVNGYALTFQSHNLSPDLNAQGNYWGTADERMIEASVFDWMEDSKMGLVDWSKFATGPADQAWPIPQGVSPSYSAVFEKKSPGVVRGVIEEDTLWGGASVKEYIVSGNLLVKEGKTLTIAKGVTLRFAPDLSIRVRGNLMAQGEKKYPIVFTGNPGTPWDRILFENRSLDAVEQMDRRKSLLSFCVVESGKGIMMDGKGADLLNCRIQNNRGTGVRIKEVSVDVKGCTITGNISDSDGGGIYAYGSQPIIIHGNVITHNHAQGGGGIFAYGYQSNVAVDMRDNLVQANTSSGDGGGIWASRSAVVDNRIMENSTENKGGGLYASFALVNDNQVTKNKAQEGGGIYCEANSALIGNIILQNTSLSGLGGGVYLNYWGLSKHNKNFDNNLVQGNTAPDPSGTGGICLNGDLDFSANAIFNNTGIQLNNLNPSTSENIKAKECYWGTLDPGKIGEIIRDGKDDPALSLVEYDPIAQSAQITKKRTENQDEEP